MSTKCFKCLTKKSQSVIQVAHTFGGQISSHFFTKNTTNASLRLYQIVICRKKRQKKSMFKTPLKPTGIQIATKSFAALQAMAPTNIKTVHQTSLLHIESNLDRLGMLSPTHDQRSQQKTGKITLQPVLTNKSKHLKATLCTEIRKNEIPRSMVVEAVSW